MKLFHVLVLAAALLFMGPGRAGASQPSPGSGNLGLTIMGGYNGSYMYYKEVENGGIMDRDYGYFNGIHTEMRLESRTLWSRLTADYSWTKNATYDGSIQYLNGQTIPYKSSTNERVNLYEGDIGYKAVNESTATLTPYVGLGYRIWWRGADTAMDYVEKYTWYYGAAGLNYVWRLDRFTAGADVAAHIPFSMKMTTNINGQYDETVFNLKTMVGFGAQLPLTYDIYSNHSGSARLLLFLTPYYQYWPVGGSDVLVLTNNGVPSTVAHEPDSRTGIYGADAGIGVNF